MADPVTVAAVGWSMKAAGWFISPIISNLVKEGSSYLGFDTSEKLIQLEIKVLELDLMLEKETDQMYAHRIRLDPLFQSLKSAFYEAEDILDDVEYHHLKRQIGCHPFNKRNWACKIHSALPSCSCMKNQESSNEGPPGTLRKKLKKSLEKIESIINEAHRILQNQSNVGRRQDVNVNSRITVTTEAPPHVVIGRDEERDKIIAMLHENVDDVEQTSNDSLSYSIVGIHGISGSGKSTLAQLVCACEKKDKQEKKVGHFDLIMWVHVSQNFSVDGIFSKMLEEATGNPCPHFNNLNTLEQKLEEALTGTRFLLVLDDVWYNGESQQKLQKLVFPLEHGKAGSKILVTSRTKDALLSLGAVRCIPMSDLDDNVFLKLFMHYALDGVNIDEPDRIKFQRIGADIAKKLRRSPLAARTVGGQLRIRPNLKFWQHALNDQGLMNETMGALWWSYQNLDEQVRRYFVFCSFFPRRDWLDRGKLVSLWMAEGFIRKTN